MTYWCIGCGETSSHEICPECEEISEELKSGLKRKKTMVNIDEQLEQFEQKQRSQKELFRSMFGHYFHLRNKGE